MGEEAFEVGVATDMIKCGTFALASAPVVFLRGEGGLLRIALPRFDQRDENCRTRRVPQPARERTGDMAWDVSVESTEMRAVGEVSCSQSSGSGTPVKMNWEDCYG